MPKYPRTTAAAQQKASALAQNFTNYQCVECGRAILRAIGPKADASLLKLRVVPGKGGVILLSSKSLLVSTTGQHVGTRIGDTVYDNHHPNGVSAGEWAGLYSDMIGGPLLKYQKPIASFFGKHLRWRIYAGFASSRFQVQQEF